MNGKNDKYTTGKMMVITVIIVFAILTAVILAFELLRKKQEEKISSAQNTQQYETTIDINPKKEDVDGIVESSTAEDFPESSAKKETTGAGISKNTAASQWNTITTEEDKVYLIKGNDKSSNRYERVDKLSYTEKVKYTMTELAHLDSYGLRITRNEIYARHGRMFNDQDMQEYFNRQSWYVPQAASNEFDETVLNEVEAYNADLIRKYELQQGY